MRDDQSKDADTLLTVRVDVVGGLRARRTEIEQAIYARIQSTASIQVGEYDVAYQDGLRAAIAATVEYCLEGLDDGAEWCRPVPPAAAAQARRAARSGVCLGTVLGRYISGHRVFGSFVMDEARRIGASSDGAALFDLRAMQEVLLEHLTAAVTREYNHERERAAHMPDQRRGEVVRKLLAGEHVESVDMAALEYELYDAWHLGIIAVGVAAEEMVERLDHDVADRLLLVRCVDGAIWAWLGSRRELPASEADRILEANGAISAISAAGNPRRGLDGWRQTHNEAQGALLRARRHPGRLTRYTDSPLLVAALQDETLARWLKHFLAPVRNDADTQGLIRALRAYIDAECNYRAAASAVELNRHTVESRIRKTETLLGRSLRTCLSELDVALQLEELNGVAY
jgi:hypothetical protein